MEEEKELHPLLKAFKERMRIFHSGEDANLSRMLESSEATIHSLVGSKDTSDPRVRELVLERARYAYNDHGNFQGDLMALSLENYKSEEKND